MHDMKLTRRQAHQVLLGLGTLIASGGVARSPIRSAQADLLDRHGPDHPGLSFATTPLALGYFKDEGFDINLVNAESSATQFQLLASGQVDIAAATPESAITARVKTGLDVKSFYAAARKTSYRVIVSRRLADQTFPDLVGREDRHHLDGLRHRALCAAADETTGEG